VIEISSIGFISKQVNITTNNQKVNILLRMSRTCLMIVVSASRTPERVLESPVTIERMGIADIKVSVATFMMV
jgi:phosphoribosylcarboxyaminoimidazole (NCAIR) mutase